MGYRYQQSTDRESDVSFRVVEILVVNNSRGRTGKSSKFLLVDNRRETLEEVQKEMQDFVRTAILANRLGNDSQGKDCCRHC